MTHPRPFDLVPHPTLFTVRWRGVPLFQGPHDQCLDLIARLDHAAAIPLRTLANGRTKARRATAPYLEEAAMASTKTQRAYQRVLDNGILQVDFYGPPPGDGAKQPVAFQVSYETSKLPARQADICVAKGFGAYAATRAAPKEGEDPTAEDIRASYDAVFSEMLNDSFEPGRASEAGPAILHEAIAEYLKLPVAQVTSEIAKGKDGTFDKATLSKIALMDDIIVIRSRLERERAMAKEKAAKDRLKAGPKGGALDLRSLFAGALAQPAAEPPAAA